MGLIDKSPFDRETTLVVGGLAALVLLSGSGSGDGTNGGDGNGGGDGTSSPTAQIDVPSNQVAQGVRMEHDGTQSSDPDGRIISYFWEFTSPNQRQFSAAGQTVYHNYDEIGDWTVRLTVFDNDGLTDSASTTISCVNA